MRGGINYKHANGKNLNFTTNKQNYVFSLNSRDPPFSDEIGKPLSYVETTPSDEHNAHNTSTSGQARTPTTFSRVRPSVASENILRDCQKILGPRDMGVILGGYSLGCEIPRSNHSTDIQAHAETFSCTKYVERQMGPLRPDTVHDKHTRSKNFEPQSLGSLHVGTDSDCLPTWSTNVGYIETQNNQRLPDEIPTDIRTTCASFCGREDGGNRGPLFDLLPCLDCRGNTPPMENEQEHKFILPIFSSPHLLIEGPNSSTSLEVGETDSWDSETAPTRHGPQGIPKGRAFGPCDASKFPGSGSKFLASSIRETALRVPWTWGFRRSNSEIPNPSSRATAPPANVLAKILRGVWPYQLKPTAFADTDKWYLPLHLKKVSRILWSEAEKLILDKYKASWVWGRKCLTDFDFLESSMRGIQVKVQEAFLSDEDIERLLRFKIIEPCQVAPRGGCKVFSIVEETKKRRRMIIEPQINSVLLYPGECSFPTLEELKNDVLLSDGAFCIDFAAYYNQFELPTQARHFFCFSCRGKLFCMMVIPTGGRQCSALAQSLTSSIAETSAANLDVKARAYNDNVRFSGNELSAFQALRCFRVLCASVNITIEEIGEQIHDVFLVQYEFLGIMWDHLSKTTALSHKSLLKLTDESSMWKSQRPSSLRQILRTCGLLIWSFRVLSLPLAHLYYLIKFIRRKLHACVSLDEPIQVWNSLVPNVCSMLNHLLSDRRALIPSKPKNLIVLFTDACLAGWGAVIFFSDGAVRIHSGGWVLQEDIVILEMRALLRGIYYLPTQTERTKVIVFVDNTTVCQSVLKQHSANFVLNTLILQIFICAEAKNLQLELHWIPSLANFADKPSRRLLQ